MISIIIPVLNEEYALPATLQHVFAQKVDESCYEVIVVDGGSIDRTADIIACEPRIAWQIARTGRANQMNAGAREANGDWLLFLHADTLLPEDALQTIAALPAEIQSGGFTHRFSGTTRGLRLVSWLHNFRCRCTHVFYGDQAMFVRRRLFFELGMFPDEPILEDLLFGEKLAAATHPVMLESAVTTDSRKFEQKGVWLSLMRVVMILVSHELRLPILTRHFFENVR